MSLWILDFIQVSKSSYRWVQQFNKILHCISNFVIIPPHKPIWFERTCVKLMINTAFFFVDITKSKLHWNITGWKTVTECCRRSQNHPNISRFDTVYELPNLSKKCLQYLTFQQLMERFLLLFHELILHEIILGDEFLREKCDL